ncbi:PQQ-dependent sugar dehydrogenase [Ramlibacter tataouinensis]|uniref:Glucose/sorbosone dehydrogenases-like protein n=1 Tax=Ramlibacter tataouinensis (strain ATCC BAA-407 / DSM 14655 / LMG 21543 / TTB310) TaxID=365046 RepID=F5XZF8_RAMTT|nr:PQQ-dependent sugar dehydrogenase [Ramlibacter tataouinensis]AEG94515.1 glucose/sorbosone dehydrogenases-like protein [Ramlibacter tataouinensis TTB310]
MKKHLTLLSFVLLAAGCAQNPPPAPTVSAAAAPVPAGVPAWQQGRSQDMAASRLAPLAGKLTATPPGEIALQNLKLPPGFKVELWAHGMPGVRAMSRTESGKIYAGTRGIGRVYEITDNGSERTSRVLVDKLQQPAVTYHQGALYVMAIDKVLRYDGIDKNPAVQPVDLTARFNLPPEQHHNWKYIAFGPDGKLYVPFGAPCNICQPGEPYAQIRRYNADGSNMEVIARGVRNTQGFDWHPVTKEMWFTDHGRDWMGDDMPEDELNRMPRAGMNFGFPYCHANGVVDRDIKRERACDGVTLPVATMGPHAAAMGVHFYTGSMFPAEYRNAMFVARKGSWNRSKKFGYDVVVVRPDAGGGKASVTPFVTGFLDERNDSFSGRPVYMLQMPDGSMLLSDEQMGAIYRISYARS